MSKQLNANELAQRTVKNINFAFTLTIAGVDVVADLITWRVSGSTEFGSVVSTIDLKNDDDKYFVGDNKINIGDEVILKCQYGAGERDWDVFQGAVFQRSKTKEQTNVISLECMDNILKLKDTDLDVNYEASKVQVTNETLTPNYLTPPNDTLAMVFNFDNDAIAQSPPVVLTIKDKNDLLEDPRYSGFEMLYSVGQVKLGSTINAKENYDVIAKEYHFYPKGLYAEDILESIISEPDGFGKFLYGYSTAQQVIDNILTETHFNMEGTNIDNMVRMEITTYTISHQLSASVNAGDTSITLTSVEGLPTSGTGDINGDIFTWSSISGNQLQGIPATGTNALKAHNAACYVDYQYTYDAGRLWALHYSNVITALVAGNFTVPGGITVKYINLRDGLIILDAPAAAGTVTCDVNYSFKTLQCVDEKTEALTKKGWKRYNKITLEDEIFTLNPETGKSEWNKVQKLNLYNYNGKLSYLKNRSFNALITDNHKWPVKNNYQCYHCENKFKKINLLETKFLKNHYIVRAAISDSLTEEIFSDDFVKLVGWYITEGCFYKYKYDKKGHWNDLKRIGSITITQSIKKYANEIKILLDNIKLHFKSRMRFDNRNIKDFIITGEFVNKLVDICPNKNLTFNFIDKLTQEQRKLLFSILIKGDGSYFSKYGRNKVFYNTDLDNINSFQYLCALMGLSTTISVDIRKGKRKILGNLYNINKSLYCVRVLNGKNTRVSSLKKSKIDYNGVIWCPTTKNKTWLMRRNGKITFTGNSTGIEITKFEAKEKQVTNRFEAISKLREFIAPNFIIHTKGTKKIWAQYMTQKDEKDYDLDVMSKITHQDDQDIYTRVVIFGKNENPKNLVFDEGVSFVTTGESYTGTAVNSELQFDRIEGDYAVYKSGLRQAGKILTTENVPVVYINNIPIDNKVHPVVMSDLLIKLRTRTETTSGGKK